MSHNNTKNKRSRHSCGTYRETKLLGIILAAFGIITICAFVLPVQAWVFLMSFVFVICGVLLFVL